MEMEGKFEESWISNLRILVKMYITGDKYDLIGFKKEAIARFEESLDFTTPQLAQMEEFKSVFPDIYTSTLPTDRDLRDLAGK
ncbi:hypothetical protein MMC21_002734 [Puttea exsequens]|nr:hypothetical protein [Puttea exsequens]